MTVRGEAVRDKREEQTRETCEPGPCQSRFSRQSRPARLSQAAEAFMNNAD